MKLTFIGIVAILILLLFGACDLLQDLSDTLNGQASPNGGNIDGSDTMDGQNPSNGINNIDDDDSANTAEIEEGSYFVYRNVSSNPYRNVLISCVESRSRICTLQRLPFIGLDTSSPAIEDIMNRVVVSHRWMGERFEQILRAMTPDTIRAVLNMSRSITALVISYDIRPSHYLPASSSIYIDPLLLALTEEENDTVDQTSDFRSNYGRDLMIQGTWRYVDDENQYLYSLSLENRDLQDVIRYTARLLFHELAHANDYYTFQTISANSCPTCAPVELIALSDRVSRNFGYRRDASPEEYYLTDENVHRYAQIRYLGRPSTTPDRAWNAEQFGDWFGEDTSVHDYSYSTNREDVAMLTEATLMKYLFDADIDIAYFDKDHPDDIITGLSPITWGERGRIGKPEIARRARKLFSVMVPGIVPDQFFDTIEPPQRLQSGCSWLDNIDLICDSPSFINPEEAYGAARHSHYSRDISHDLAGPHG